MHFCSAAVATVIAISLLLAPGVVVADGDVASDEEVAVETEVPVHVGEITRATLRSFVVGYGVVEPEPASRDKPAASARIASPVSGVVAAISCSEGQRVEKGAELVRLDTRVTDALIEKAATAVAFAEKNLARERRLLSIEGASQKQVEESEQQLQLARTDAANAQAQRALQIITAPAAGTVVRVAAKAGEAVDLTTVLVELIDLDRLVVNANIAAAEAQALRLSQPAELLPDTAEHSAADPAATPLGSVTLVSPQIDPKTDTVSVRVSVPPGAGLRPGQFVSIRIVTDERRDRLAVPQESVVRTAAGTVIAVVEGDHARQVAVKVGVRDRGLVEVEADGLRAGVPVVTGGAYGLPKETKIRVLDAPRTEAANSAHVAH